MNALNDLVLPGKAALQSLSPSDGLERSLRGVNQGFGDRRVLHDVDFQVVPGEFVAVVGRSGSGKSTLLRLLAGLDTPDSGTVTLGGKSPAAQGSNVRIMFQDGRLLPWRRVIDNVALGLARADRPRAEAALAATGLADRAREWPRVLSGGQKQRVALARALATQPRLILLDEPLGALDALTRLEMQRLIEQLWQRGGFTAVLVTHDVAEAALLADRVVLIEHGRIALDLRIDLPRPREPGEEMSRIERTVLHRILGG
jgi:sulfonate transport system ATP-binding protein